MTNIYTVINNSNFMDHPHTVSFVYRKDALNYVQELYKNWLEGGQIDPDFPLPEPEEFYCGLQYTFDDHAYDCVETVHLIETELLGE